jgi:hypothetical protein
MKRLILALAVSFLIFSKALSTEQIADILIIGKDTIYLKSFPLEDLRLLHKLKPPFNYGEYPFPHTACYRGYIAIWQVIDETLVLNEVVKLDSLDTRLNVVEYLKNNNYNPRTMNGNVIADWYSDTLKNYDFFSYNLAHRLEKFYIGKDFWEDTNKRIELVFEKGKLVKNNIIPIEDYKIGDTLSLDVYYSQNWLIEYKSVLVSGIIRKNNGKKVQLELFFWGTDKKRIKKKVQKEIGSIFWINPRYCKK